ncbi:RNA polymerase sigma factor [Spirosoma sp. SC4-14]|uniref:RNA polymerase sigma factor n=1 Tax=Spirosoma sp. SC4-14 TaxID=3128900 RepID=UPI0030CB297D
MKKPKRHRQPPAYPLPPGSEANNFEQLYRQYVHKVFRTCMTLTNNSASAQDYTQDIFLKVFDKLDSFQNRSSLSTWLYAVSYNHCLTQLKKESRKKMEPIADLPFAESLADDWPPDIAEERRQAQETSLRELPPEELTLLRLKYEDGLSIRALSQQYNLSESAVKMRLKRTRDRLQASVHRRLST